MPGGHSSAHMSPAPGTGSRSLILVVEDQPDVRQMLATALRIEGHAVDEAANAAEGLKRLQEQRYNLVLSDYAMPGGTGTWMLHEASRLGLMENTVALIVTAHPEVSSLTEVEVISKPLDLDFFLDQVRRLLASGPQTSGDGDAETLRDARGPSTPRVELVLYVSSSSPASVLARRNLERLLAKFDGSQIKWTICDLVRDPLAGEADRIAFTPTLVKRFPEPRMWVLGNLREPDVVEDLLRVCGVDAGE
jgi:CheY-like chemotaxis protein